MEGGTWREWGTLVGCMESEALHGERGAGVFGDMSSIFRWFLRFRILICEGWIMWSGANGNVRFWQGTPKSNRV